MSTRPARIAGVPPPPPLASAPTAPAVHPAEERWRRRIDDFSDWVNPAVVKALRQGLRTRMFWVSFSLVLLVCVLISIEVYVRLRDEQNVVDGNGAFIAYLVCISVVQFFIVPFTAYLSLLRERNEAGWTLLTLTGLGARRILHGKHLAFCLQSALYASAAVPFLLFCYYLNGVDVLRLVAAMVLGTAFNVFLLSCALFTAGMSFGPRIDRTVDSLTTFLALGGLLMATPVGFAIMWGTGKALATHPPSFLVGLLSWTWGIMGLAMFALEIGVDFLARMTERDARPRKYVPALFTLASAGAAFILWVVWRV